MPATTVYTIAAELLECARVALDEGGQPDPCRICVVPGEISWDQCANGGQLIMGINRVYYSNSFPLELTGENSGATNPLCGPAMVVADLTLSLMRCAPGPTGNPPRFPTCAALDAVAQLVALDSFYLRSGILCCLRDLQKAYTIVDYRVAAANVDGPIGDCVGNELSILVAVTHG